MVSRASQGDSTRGGRGELEYSTGSSGDRGLCGFVIGVRSGLSSDHDIHFRCLLHFDALSRCLLAHNDTNSTSQRQGYRKAKEETHSAVKRYRSRGCCPERHSAPHQDTYVRLTSNRPTVL